MFRRRYDATVSDDDLIQTGRMKNEARLRRRTGRVKFLIWHSEIGTIKRPCNERSTTVNYTYIVNRGSGFGEHFWPGCPSEFRATLWYRNYITWEVGCVASRRRHNHFQGSKVYNKEFIYVESANKRMSDIVLIRTELLCINIYIYFEKNNKFGDCDHIYTIKR